MVVGPLTSFRRFTPDVTDIGSWPIRLLRACLADAIAERERRPLWIPVGFGTGIGLYFSFYAEPSLLLVAAIGAVGIGCAALSFRIVTHGCGRRACHDGSGLDGFCLCKAAHRMGLGSRAVA